MFPSRPQNTSHRLQDNSSRCSALRGDLRFSVIDGAAYGAMVGFGETYLAAFVLAMSLGEVTAGLVTTIPMVIGGILQLVSPLAVRRLGSHKRWVVACAAMQALAFVPLAVAAFVGQLSGLLVFLVAGLYWTSGLSTGAAWNAWIGTVVPARIRPKFFARRTRTSHLMVFGGFLSGGLFLQFADWQGFELQAFAVLFTLAGLSRCLSVVNLARQREPVPLARNMAHLPWHGVLGFLRQDGSGRLLVYLVFVQAAVQMSGPYYAPFLLRELHVSYAQFVLLLSLSYLSKVIAMPMWGRLGQRVGAKSLLWIGGVGIIPASALWIWSQNIFWLGALQVMSGTFWAAYELGFFLLFFESIEERERTSVLTYFNLFNTLAWVCGSVVGGLFLSAFGTSYLGYLLLFGISATGRGLSLFLLARVPHLDVRAGQIGVRAIAVRLGSSSEDSLDLPSLPDQVAEEKLAA